MGSTIQSFHPAVNPDIEQPQLDQAHETGATHHAHAQKAAVATVISLVRKRSGSNAPGAMDQEDENIATLLRLVHEANPKQAQRLLKADNKDDAEFDELQANVNQMTQADQEQFNSAVEEKVKEGGSQDSASEKTDQSVNNQSTANALGRMMLLRNGSQSLRTPSTPPRSTPQTQVKGFDGSSDTIHRMRAASPSPSSSAVLSRAPSQTLLAASVGSNGAALRLRQQGTFKGVDPSDRGGGTTGLPSSFSSSTPSGSSRMSKTPDNSSVAPLGLGPPPQPAPPGQTGVMPHDPHMLDGAIHPYTLLVDPPTRQRDADVAGWRTQAQQAQKANIENAEALPAQEDNAKAMAKVASELKRDVKLKNSRGLKELLDHARAIHQGYANALNSGSTQDMEGVLRATGLALDRCKTYQEKHVDRENQAKFNCAETLRRNFVDIQQGMSGLKGAMEYVNTQRGSGEGGIAKAAQVLISLQSSVKVPEAKTLLTAQHDQLANQLPQGLEEREVGRLLGGAKERENFKTELAAVGPDLGHAEHIIRRGGGDPTRSTDFTQLKREVGLARGKGDYLEANAKLAALRIAAKNVKEANTTKTAAARARRELANASYRGKAPTEIAAMAKSLGPEEEAAYVRQREPMRGLARASIDSAERRHRDAKLQDPAKSRNAEVARSIAERLINKDGGLDVVGLYLHNPQELVKELNGTPHSQQLAKGLERLRDDVNLQHKLTSIGKPDQENPACQLIRADLGLGPDEVVTEVHARKAALTSLLAELRQGPAGTCFGTFHAIAVHKNDPARFLDDVKELIETGTMTRVHADGTKSEMPINMTSPTGALETKVTVDNSGNLTKVEGESVASHHISRTPSFEAMLHGMGIPPDERQQVVASALDSLRQSTTQAAMSAIAAKVPERIPGARPGKTQRNPQREQLLNTLPAMLKGMPQGEAKNQLKTELENQNIAEKDEILAAFDQYFMTAEHEFTPDDILHHVALAQAGLTDGDVAKRERHDHMRLDVWAAATGTNQQQANALIDKHSQEASELEPKRANFEKFDKLSAAAQNAYLAQQDNRLLRGFEYTVTAMAEQGVSQSYAPHFKKATTDQMRTEIDNVAANAQTTGGATPSRAMIDALGLLKDKFKEKFDANVRMGYDASKKLMGTSADGSSSRGAFCMFDQAGIVNPNEHVAINDKRAYVKLIEGTMNQAIQEVKDSVVDDEVRKYVQEIGTKVAGEVAQHTERFATDASALMHQDIRPSLLHPNEPWAAGIGNDNVGVLSAYYGKDVVAARASVAKVDCLDLNLSGDINERDLTNWLRDQGLAIRNKLGPNPKVNPDALVPMTCQVHAFNFRLGDPAVQKMLDWSPSPSFKFNDYARNFRAAEKQKYNVQEGTRLTPELREILLEDATKGWPDEMAQALRTHRNVQTVQTAGMLAKEMFDYVSCNSNKLPKPMNTRTPVYASVMKNVLPPFEVVGGGQNQELSEKLDEVLPKLNLSGQQRAEVKNAVVGDLVSAASGASDRVSMTDIQDKVVKVLNDRGIRTDPQAAQDVFNALRPTAPPGIPFADSNWGGGDHHALFTMVRDPDETALRIWKMNEDGTQAKELGGYFVAGHFTMVTDPSLIAKIT
jgi:hypothetical protein